MPKDSKSATDYTWTADASWVSVTDGVVKFTGTGTGSKVTITGTPTSGQGKIIKYRFTLKSWFINNGNTETHYSDADAYCSSQSGYSLPTVAQMTLHNNYTATETRGTGALWNEWGSLPRYTGAGYIDSGWSSEKVDRGMYSVGLTIGDVTARGGGQREPYAGVVCRQGL